MTEKDKLIERVDNRIDDMINDNQYILEFSELDAISTEEKRDLELLQQRLTGANEALLDIKFRLKG